MVKRRPSIDQAPHCNLTHRKTWWSCEDENENWCLEIFASEYRTYQDKWGYGPAELHSEVQKLIPMAPKVITAFEIAKQLNRTMGHPTKAFVKTIQKRLRLLRERGHAKAKPYKKGRQLGWHLPVPEGTIEVTPETSNFPTAARPAKKPNPLDEDDIIGTVEALLPRTPRTIAADSIAKAVTKIGLVAQGDALQVVLSSLRKLQLRRQARAVRLESATPEIAWQKEN